MDHPYKSLPEKAFWRPAIAERYALDIAELWEPKADLAPTDKVATFGSCFAQHFGKALAKRGYAWFDAERPPAGVSEALKRKFNYGVFSARTQNIYTAALFRQWVFWALGLETPPEELWEEDGRWFDPFRPTVEPEGYASAEELLASRETTLTALRRVIDEARLFVFTMGLTEGWLHHDRGYVYAACPGTAHGAFDPKQHVFRNFTAAQIHADMEAALGAIRDAKPGIRFLLTVSPVPLTATASGMHVLTATVHSKSTLRAVAGELSFAHEDVDYFPSYEIITGPPFRSMFFEPNMRSVSPHGVDFVMRSFFDCLGRKFGLPDAVAEPERPKARQRPAPEKSEDDVVCEEEMLEAFADGDKAAQ